MSVITVDFSTRRGPAPLLRTRLPELGTVTPLEHRCPAWCTQEGAHDRHLAATGAVGARTPGRMDIVTVLVQREHGGDTLVDLRALSPDTGRVGALLNADALDDVIAALTHARRLMGATSPRSLPHGGGRASTSPVPA